MNLEELRIDINKCNEELFNILKKRFSLTRKIGEIKAKNNLKPCDKKRRNIILDEMKILAKKNNINEIMVEKIFKTIMKQVVKEHKEIRKKIKK